MLIKLSRPATLNSFVQTVALPSRCPVADENCIGVRLGATCPPNGSEFRVQREELPVSRDIKRPSPSSALNSIHIREFVIWIMARAPLARARHLVPDRMHPTAAPHPHAFRVISNVAPSS